MTTCYHPTHKEMGFLSGNSVNKINISSGGRTGNEDVDV